MFNKKNYLAVAEAIDALRVIPRIMIFGWWIFYMMYTIHLTESYLAMPDPSIAQSSFVTAVISALGTMSIFLGNIYIKSGRTWSK